MKTSLAILSALFVLSATAASAQRGDTMPMRDGSTVVIVGGCLVQYGARGQRINNAVRCEEGEMQQADRIMAGGGRPGFGGYDRGFGGGGVPSGSWAQSCRGGQMRGQVFQAECRDTQDRWNATVLDMRNCSTGQAENRNGSLVCR